MQLPRATREWDTRPPLPADVAGVLDLFQRSFGRRVTAAHYEWKLRTRPGPAPNAAIALDDSGRPVFHFGGIPCRCLLAGRERWAMVAVDGMTDPAFRRRGLLSQVGASIVASWRDAGVDLVLGLPNEQWGSRVAALGWRPLFPLGWLVRPVAPQRLLARRLGLPLLGRAGWVGRCWNVLWDRPPAGDVSVREVSRAGEEIDQVWRRIAPAVRCSLVKDAAWVNWRYLAAPDGNFRVLLAARFDRPAGYAAFRVREGTGLIADVVVAPGDVMVFESLVAAAVSRLVASGVATVRGLAIPGSWVHGAFRRLGFWRSRHAFAVHAVLLNPDLREAELRDPATWLLAGGDFDVV